MKNDTLFLKLETTGPDITRHDIISVSVELLDEHCNPTGDFEALLQPRSLLYVDKEYIDAHQQSGLWKRVQRTSNTSIEDIEAILIQWLVYDNELEKAKTVLLNKKNKPFIKKFMPNLDKMLIYSNHTNGDSDARS